MRVFVAVSPPPEARRAALDAARGAAADLLGIRWTREENVHITLKFLGEVAEETLEGVRGALREACSAHAPFDARLGGLGVFPSPRRARVVWAGVDEGSGEISVLAESVEAALEPLGLQRERRPYVPHATLGRAREAVIGTGLSETPVTDAPTFRVRNAGLVKSTLTPEGSIYENLEVFALKGVD